MYDCQHLAGATDRHTAGAMKLAYLSVLDHVTFPSRSDTGLSSRTEANGGWSVELLMGLKQNTSGPR